jgi:hypothetical protein
MKVCLFLLLNFFYTNHTATPKKIRNTFSSDLQLVKYSKVFIKAPGNFHELANSMGFGENETGASFTVIQEFKPYKLHKDQINITSLNSKDNKLIEISELKINGLSSTWYEYESKPWEISITNYILLIGNKNEHVYIKASCNTAYPLACMAMKKSILGLYYDMDSTHIKSMISKAEQ